MKMTVSTDGEKEMTKVGEGRFSTVINGDVLTLVVIVDSASRATGDSGVTKVVVD